MSITKAREARIMFTDHYLRSGLVAAMRVEDAKKFNSLESIMQGSLAVGVVKNTTADAFVRRSFPNVLRISSLSKASDGVFELRRRTIDIFMHDAPAIVWLVSENEADITALWELFNEEYLAWGIRKDKEAFLIQVNSILREWKNNRKLNEILNKWLPPQYMKRFY